MLRFIASALVLAFLPSGVAFAQYYDPYPPVPEPGSALLLLIALAVAARVRSRPR